jgi:hypothetical protein
MCSAVALTAVGKERLTRASTLLSPYDGSVAAASMYCVKRGRDAGSRDSSTLSARLKPAVGVDVVNETVHA